jgi:hypothetical protein
MGKSAGGAHSRKVATKARHGGEEDGESGAAAGLSLAVRENERGAMGVRSSGPTNGGRRGRGEVGGATRATTVEEGPGQRLRSSHGRHVQRAAAYIASREMSERERADMWALLQNLINFEIIQIRSNLIQPKPDIPELQKF